MTDLPIRDAFEWTREPWGRALRCTPVASVADHLFTSRDVPLESIEQPLGLGWAAAARSIGADPGAVVRLRQVHGATIFVAGSDGARSDGDGPPPQADGVITSSPGLALAVRVADCSPILLADRRLPVVAAIHAGWRGSCAGIVAATVAALARSFGSSPHDLVAAVGPSIGPCCYRVGREVREAFACAGASDEQLGRWFLADPAPRPDAGGPEWPGRREANWELGASDFRLPVAEQLIGFPGTGARPGAHVWADLWMAASDQLVASGLAAEHVHVARLCTCCHTDLFYSYRADGTTGRTAGMIRIGASS
jgi:YfiH family protein